MSNHAVTRIPALVVRQWLPSWDEVTYSEGPPRFKPEPYFYTLTMPAYALRRLSDIYRRKAEGPRPADTGIQRAHDPKRSEEIARFVQGGFPWSTLSEMQRQAPEFSGLRMPGWLPTAIIANILPPLTNRNGRAMRAEEAIQIEHNGNGLATLILPVGYKDESWNPTVAPIEIIDGQHRLWAFDSVNNVEDSFEVPIVAFHGLDITWQAYLFYTINIKPKRINPSLAYDLYPILRIQDWLEKDPSSHAIYRETRAQELTEALWSDPTSPWRRRINMLGDRKSGSVTQAAFVRALVSSYLQRRDPRRNLGGLFGAELEPGTARVLAWNRPQQAALLIRIWQVVEDAVRRSGAVWARQLRGLSTQSVKQGHLIPGDEAEETESRDAALSGQFSLLASDQGVRGVLHVTNDLLYVSSSKLALEQWPWAEDEVEEDTITPARVAAAMEHLITLPLDTFLKGIAQVMSEFDWRTSSTPDLPDPDRTTQLAYRGSGGYKELRRRLITKLAGAENQEVSDSAQEVFRRMGP